MEGEPTGDDLEVLVRACQLVGAGDEAAPELARLDRASPHLVMGDRVTRHGPNHSAGTPVTLDVSL